MPSLRSSKKVARERKLFEGLCSGRMPKCIAELSVLIIAAFVSLALFLFVWRQYELPLNIVTAGLFFLCASFSLCFVILFIAYRYKANKLISIADEYAAQDSLTGIRSYFGFRKGVEDMLARSGGRSRMILVFDIKCFKYINDAYGYSVGDETLIHISKVLAGMLSRNDLYGRIGGDSFLLMREYLGDDEFGMFFNELVSRIQKAPVCIRHKCKLYLSAGVYIFEGDADSLGVNAMVDRAMLARSTVKNQGVTGYAVYTEKMREHIRREKEIERELAEALDNGELEICFQPIYDIQKGDLIFGAEALVRCNSSRLGLLYPSSFIPLIEKNGFIVEMDRYVFRQICRYLRERLDRRRHIVSISVNVSRIDMCQADFIEVYSGIKREYRIPDGKIHLEFAESIAYEDYERFSNLVGELKRNGFVCSLDDFGKGNSSLNVIKDLQVDVLKLDMLFFRDKEYRSRAEAVVTSIISMAKALGMKTVAEGVETRDQVEFLRKIGCDAVQGYVFAKPMPPHEMDDYIDELPKREIMLESLNSRQIMRTDEILWPDSDSRAQYEAALQFTDSMVTEIDLDRGLFHIVVNTHNGAAHGAASGSYDEHIRRMAVERIHPDDREKWLDRFSSKGLSSAFARGENRISLRYRALDASNKGYIWYEKTVIMLNNGNGGKYRALSFIKDIHMKKWTEQNGGESRVHLACELLDLYSSIYEINLDSLTFRKLSIGGHAGPKTGNYRDLLESIASAMSAEERAAYLDTFSPGNLRRKLENERTPVHMEYRERHDGETHWYSATVTRIDTMPGHYLAMMLIRDISDEFPAELGRRGKLNRLKNVIVSTFEDILEVDLKTDRIERIGDEARFDGTRAGKYTEYVEQLLRSFIHPDDRGRFLTTFGREALIDSMVMEGPGEKIDRFRLADPQGNYHWMRFCALRDPGNDPDSLVIYLYRKNIDSSMRGLEILQETADRDSLTGVYNGRIFERNVRENLAKSRNKLHALMIIDVDDFGKINDRWGFMAGDETLASVSNRIVQCFRNEDIIGRIGGDEFVIFMKDIPSAESALKKADEVCRVIRGLLGGGTYEGSVTVSIGIALSGIDGHTYEDLFRKADIALFRAKENGKNRSQLFSIY